MFRLLFLAFVCALLPLGVSARDILQERIVFAQGTSGTTINGRITGDNITDYLLRATAGQQMTVTFAPDNSFAYFNVLQGDDPTALHVGSRDGGAYSGTVPATGDYRIRVYLMRAAARRDEVANYRLSVTIGEAAAPAPDYADGLAGGPDWWAVTGLSTGDALNVRSGPGTRNAVIGQLGNGDRVRNRGCQMNGDTRWCQIEFPGDQVVRGWVAGRYLREAAAPSDAGSREARGSIPCAVLEGQPMGSCTFRVSRGTGGTASVWVALPSGGERYLDFRDGTLVGSDPGKETHQEKSGDLNLIWIDGVERFEIPDAVIYGG
jgi:uncharacterized protein YraI